MNDDLGTVRYGNGMHFRLMRDFFPGHHVEGIDNGVAVGTSINDHADMKTLQQVLRIRDKQQSVGRWRGIDRRIDASRMSCQKRCQAQ